MTPPTLLRLRHDLKRRLLTVETVTRLGPSMLRFTLTGDELDGFVSAAPDDHIKLIFPQPDGAPAMRDYTPRAFDPVARRLTLDFVDHPGGPAADWARTAKVGDTLQIGGPRGSRVLQKPPARLLLIGDETALPAMGRWIDEAPATTEVTALIAVSGPEDEQRFARAAALHWVHRPLSQADQAAPLLEALASLRLDPETYVWIAAEAGVARALRDAVTARGVAPGWLRAAGYWIKGEADASIKDLAEGAES